MRAFVLLALIACAHVAFLIGAYGTGLFGAARFLPYPAVLAIWLGGSSLLAGLAYFRAGSGLARLSRPMIAFSFAVIATAISLYVGVFGAFNSFGT